MDTNNEALRNHGLKVTVPRIKILQTLASSTKTHLSAEDIYQELLASEKDVGIATVYRVLTQFEAAGIVKRHHFEGGHAVFELDQGDHHDHLVCTNCGKVAEFVDNEIELRQMLIARQNGFDMTDHNLTIYGRCPACII